MKFLNWSWIISFPNQIRTYILNSCLIFIDGHLFWSDWGSPAQIERAGMDGSQRTIFLTGNMSIPNGLAIDYETSRIYWTDARSKTIEYASLTGKGRNILSKRIHSLKDIC